jgi:excisionase family DNA binding protein
VSHPDSERAPTGAPLLDDVEEAAATSRLDPASLRAPVQNDTAAYAEFLTADELAVLLRLNRKTVYDALARGDIPGARRIGGTYRILRSAVLAWFARQDRVSRSRRKR